MGKKIIELKLGELFCGPGGIGYGAQNARVETNHEIYKIKHEWANDIHAETCLTYKKNINIDPSKVFCCDVKDLDIKNLSNIDIFAYGFPCNDFSHVGKKRGFGGKYGYLYRYGIDVLDRFNPIFFLAENVSGLKSSSLQKAFRKILFDLENAGKYGYSLTVHEYKFEEYGVPQKRHRLIIVGFRKDSGLKFKVPKPTHEINYLTAKEALADIPENAPNHEFTKQSQTVIERLKRIRPGQNIWDVNDQLPKELRLHVKGAKLSQIYKRLHPKEPSYTITGSGGGGTHVYHYEEPRALTNRERARLQTFPDDFVFYGKKESIRRQIGMAVSPKMSEIIFSACLKTLAGVQYEWVQESWQHQGSLF